MCGVLDDADHRRVLDVLGHLSDPANPGDFGGRALRAIRELIPCDVAALNDVDVTRDHFVFAFDPADFVVPENTLAVLTELAGTHPLVNYTQRTGDGSARRITDVVSQEVFVRSELYLRCYAPMGVTYQMAVTLALPKPAVVAITVSRGSSDFTDRERALLDVVRPHLSHGWTLAREVARLTGLLGLSRPPSVNGTLALALTEPVGELTPGALAELYRFFGVPSARSSLPPRVQRWLSGMGSGGARSLLATRGSRHALLRHVASEPGQPAILLLDADVDPGPGMAALGLTPREIEVLNLLATGATNERIAADLHVAAGTVKKHLDNVYAKLGVRGRLQAVTRAIELSQGVGTK